MSAADTGRKNKSSRRPVKGLIRYTKAAAKAKIKKDGRILASQAFVKKGVTNVQPKSHLKLGDTVVVVSGDDKGKIGKVIEIFKAKSKIIVEGVNIRKKHQKGRGPGQEGEVVEQELPIYSSKVMLWDEEQKKATRVGKKTLESGEKVRISKVSGEQID